MTDSISIATYNIHKGFSNFNRRLVVHELRDRLRSLRSDLIFLQEVQGAHTEHSRRVANWPIEPQYEFLADEVWADFAYGKNAIYNQGHHGNAILSRFPIVSWVNEDISAHAFESRGLLHCELQIPGWEDNLHCICVHLGIFGRGRMQQINTLCDRIEHMVPAAAPLVIAGDFNDWRQRASKVMRSRLGLREVFELTHGRPARSYPSGMPLLRLDRIYVRGFRVSTARLLHGHHWAKLSDHTPLSANLVRL